MYFTVHIHQMTHNKLRQLHSLMTQLLSSVHVFSVPAGGAAEVGCRGESC